MLGFVLDRKEAFLDYKNINSKVEILLFFFKGVSPWFWSKALRFLPRFRLNRLRKSFW